VFPRRTVSTRNPRFNRAFPIIASRLRPSAGVPAADHSFRNPRFIRAFPIIASDSDLPRVSPWRTDSSALLQVDQTLPIVAIDYLRTDSVPLRVCKNRQSLHLDASIIRVLAYCVNIVIVNRSRRFSNRVLASVLSYCYRAVLNRVLAPVLSRIVIILLSLLSYFYLYISSAINEYILFTKLSSSLAHVFPLTNPDPDELFAFLKTSSERRRYLAGLHGRRPFHGVRTGTVERGGASERIIP